ncbi:MAG: hypothetical protein GX896_00700 [Clostridiales bacterium]|nr:hypothetical protein [Clostridiales bacterium]
MKKLKTIQKAISLMALALIVFASCDSDDDGNGAINEPKVEPIVLDCSIITETTVLENRGSGIDYIWPCLVKVEAPLIIEPGVTIAFEQGGGLEVKDYGERTGSLTAIGTADKPIVFTGTSKTPGAWKHIYMNSGDLNNKLHNVIIEYAGNTDGKSPALSVINEAKAEIQNTTVRNNKGIGVFVGASGNIEEWKANTITDNQGYPMQISTRKVKFLDGTQSTYSDNGTNQIYVNTGSLHKRGFIEDEINGPKHTWLDPGIPYFVDERIIIIKDRGNNKPGHLQIKEGSELIFGEGYGIEVQYYNTVLEVLGTTEKPVKFTGQHGAGSWKGINIQKSNSNLNLIKNAIIENAGESPWNWFSQQGGISLGSQTGQIISLKMENVLIKNSAGSGVIERRIKDGSKITYDNVTFENNAGQDYYDDE